MKRRTITIMIEVQTDAPLEELRDKTAMWGALDVGFEGQFYFDVRQVTATVAQSPRVQVAQGPKKGK